MEAGYLITVIGRYGYNTTLNKALERDQAYCGVFSEVSDSGKFNFLS